MAKGEHKIAEIDAADVEALIARAETQLRADDHALLKGICESFVALQRLVRQRGTTIARLRRLVGTTSSEKSAEVIKGNDAPGAANTASDTARKDGDLTAPDAGEEEKQKKGHGRIKAADYPDAEHIAVTHETLVAKEPCPACDKGTLYRMKEPVQFLRIIGRPPLCAVCFDLEQLRCSACGKVFTAQPPPQAQGKKFSDTAASMMTLLRYGIGLPLNRLDHLQSWLQTPVPASTQWDVAHERVDDVRPVHTELLRLAAQGTVVHNDDTFVRILQFMGKRRAKLLRDGKLEDEERTGLFTTAIVAMSEERPIATFFSGRKHAGENLTTLFEKRGAALDPPLLMSDALERNLPEGVKVDWANCLAHGRRGVVDEIENFPTECEHIIKELSIVFAVEARAKRERLSVRERLRLHQEDSRPVMERLETWLRALDAEKRIEPNSGMGAAVNYLLKRWRRFCRFLEVAGAPLDNNITERALKMAIRHRNASLFYKTLRGAKVGDVYMTLIHTAVLHGENPFHYLTSLFTHAPAVAMSPAAWLPWTYRATLARRDANPSAEQSLH